MKPIIKQEQQDTILTSEITDRHLVVAVINNEPCILTKGHGETKDRLCFMSIGDAFTNGNGYRFGTLETIKDMTERAMSDKDSKVAVFPQSDWKAALQWLIDNA